MAHAKVFITVMGQDDAGKIALNMEILNDAAGYLRMLLGKSMKLPQRAATAFPLRRKHPPRRRAVGADPACGGRDGRRHGDDRGLSVAQVKRYPPLHQRHPGARQTARHEFNQALQKVRWLLNAEKAGHTGSLDPLATGVLPLCFGEATKFSRIFSMPTRVTRR